jgi:acetoin utilization deacetylase AcuC-like enzyme
MRLAAEFSDGRLVAVLEGGYDLQALADSGRAVIEELGHDAGEPVESIEGANRAAPIIQRAHYFRDQHCHEI